MADSIVRLRIDSQEYDANIKRAGDALKRYFDTVKQGGGTLAHLDEGVLDATKALGQLGTMANGTRASISEMTSAFTDFSMRYKQLTEEEKRGDVGKALRTSLDQLKGRIKDAKADLAGINQELYGGKFGQFGGIIDSIGKKMGVTGNLTEILTSKTALMTAGIGAAAAAVYKGTEAWTKYNSELAKQDQTTTMVTGLDGTAANVMTDKMRALAATYSVDFRQAIEAANTLMSQFGKSGEEATQLIKDGMQGMLHGDGQKLLQMIQQYAPAFRDAGVSASQLIAVIHNSQGGIFTAENMNAIVMGIKNIRLMSKQTSEALAKLGLDGQDMARKMSDGSMSVFDALKQVVGKLKECEAGSQTTGVVMQAVFGRSGVTAGQNLAKAIEGLNTNLEETKKQTGEVGQAFNDLQTAYEGLNTAIRDAFSYDGYQEMATGIKTELVNALAEVIEQLGKIKALWLGLSEGQAKKKLYGTSGIPDEVRRDLEALQNANEAEREQLYLQQRAKYEKRYGQATRQEQYERAWMNNEGESWWQRNNPLSLVGRWWFARNAKSAGNTVAAEADVMSEYNKAAREIVYGKKEEIKPTDNNNNNNNNNNNLRKTKQEVDLIDGSIAALNKQLQDLQKTQSQALTPESWQNTQKEIEKTILQIEAFKGKWKEGLQATFRINAEVPEEKTVVFKADDTDVLEKARQISGVHIDEKTLTVTALTEDAEVALRNLDGMKPQPKFLTVTALTAEAEESLRKMGAEQIGDKTFRVTVEMAGTLTQLQDVNTYKISDKTLTVTALTAEAEESLRKMGAEQIGDKIFRVTAEMADTITQLQDVNAYKIDDKEVAVNAEIQAAIDKLKEIDGVTFDPKTLTVTANTAEAYNKCQELFKGIEGTTVEFSVVPKIQEMAVGVNIQNSEGLSQYISQLQNDLKTADFGSQLYNSIAEQLADMSSLQNLVTESMKQGLGTAMFDVADEAGADFWTRAMEGGVENIDWQGIVDKINEARKANGLDAISLDFDTGNIKSVNKLGTEMAKDFQGAASAIGQLGSAMSNIEDPAAKVFGIVSQAIATVALTFAKSLKGTVTPWDWIAAAISGTATMIATIASIKSATSGNFAEGGIVPGNHFSGDNMRGYGSDGAVYGLNSGELILNRSQQDHIAGQLIGGQQQGVQSSRPYTTGEQIYLGLSAYLSRTGKGELVTSKG